MKAPELPPYNHQPKPYRGPPCEEVLRLKNRYMTPTSFPYYKTPLMIVEGSGRGRIQLTWPRRPSGKWIRRAASF